MDATKVSQLQPLLQACCARVTVKGKQKGTAFFVARDLLLTCRHVVKEAKTAADIEVIPAVPGATPLSLAADPELAEGRDLALLRVNTGTAKPVWSCVALDEGATGLVDVTFSGFPTDTQAGTGFMHKPGTCSVRDAMGTGEPDYLELYSDHGITVGNSGGPVLSHNSGAVIGVVRASKDIYGPGKGSAIPIQHATEAFPDVQRACRRPPAGVEPWRDILGPQGWAALGKPWGSDALVRVSVKGQSTGWSIREEGADPGLPEGGAATLEREVTGNELGADVGEALFRWARRRGFRDEEDVSVLGKLLYGALFPNPIAHQLATHLQAAGLDLRLTIEPTSDLVEIPWELAVDPTSDFPRSLAAQSGSLFVRMLPGPRPRRDPPADRVVKVMAAVSLPDLLDGPQGPVRGKEAERLRQAQDERLRQAIEGSSGGPFSSTRLVNPRPSELSEMLGDTDTSEGAAWDVFHFVGYGQTTEKTSVEIAFAGEPGKPWNWRPLKPFLELAGGCGAALVVLEFLSRPATGEARAVSVKELMAVIPEAIPAVIANGFPVDAVDARDFNGHFYKCLRERRTSVDAAVQVARYRLSRDAPSGDFSAFGWFSMFSRCEAEVYLVQQPSATEPQTPTGGPPGRVPGVSAAQSAAHPSASGQARDGFA